MRKIVLLTGVLALLATWTAAQQQNGPSGENASNQNRTMVRGCLTGAVGQYQLVDDNHIVYRVEGNDKELSSFNGKQVEIKGNIEEDTPPKEQQTASSFSQPERHLTPASINKISDTCTGASE
jgi:hypothetical protein